MATASYYSNGVLVNLTGNQAANYNTEQQRIAALEAAGEIDAQEAAILEAEAKEQLAADQAEADYGVNPLARGYDELEAGDLDEPIDNEDPLRRGYDDLEADDLQPEDFDSEQEPGFDAAFLEDDYDIQTVDEEDVDGMMDDADYDEENLDEFELDGYGDGSDEDMAGNGDEFMSSVRMRDLPPGAETGSSVTVSSSASWKDDTDWRVMLSLPSIKTYKDSKVLKPLYNLGRLIFPLTPSVNLSYNANYGTVQPVHSNYPFLNYESSSVDEIQITADWAVETQLDGKYWIAAKHLLNSLTKMFYGDGEFVGAPPPIVKLYGYGDHIFPGVPVVVKSFQMTLAKEIDYVRINYDNEKYYVPSFSTFEIRLAVMYSRDTARKFNLADFVSGKLLNDQGKFI